VRQPALLAIAAALLLSGCAAGGGELDATVRAVAPRATAAFPVEDLHYLVRLQPSLGQPVEHDERRPFPPHGGKLAGPGDDQVVVHDLARDLEGESGEG
jgi:hypothetical protein